MGMTQGAGHKLGTALPAATIRVDASPCGHRLHCYRHAISLPPPRPSATRRLQVWQRTYLVGCAIGVCPDGVSYVGGVWMGKLYVSGAGSEGFRGGAAGAGCRHRTA